MSLESCEVAKSGEVALHMLARDIVYSLQTLTCQVQWSWLAPRRRLAMTGSLSFTQSRCMSKTVTVKALSFQSLQWNGNPVSLELIQLLL